MKNIYTTAHTIVSPLGFSTLENCENLRQDITSIQKHNIPTVHPTPFYASLINDEVLKEKALQIKESAQYTKLEQMMILALQQSINQAPFSISSKTGLVIATTKGNIDALEKQNLFSKERAYLSNLARAIQDYFGFTIRPIVVSNACTSGIMGISTGKKLIEEGYFKNAFIVGGDIISKFTVSGFQSFQALSNGPCKPYSTYREGLSLGEGAAALALSRKRTEDSFTILGDASRNDANHISGPSRTGEGLYLSIKATLKEAGLHAQDIDYISGHGTATVYNDEMESIAFYRAGLTHVPINSFKGYLGHTLGASGIIESILGMQSVSDNILYKTLGYDVLGVSKPINIINKTHHKSLDTFLKTASGFGGTNSAILFKKI